MRAAMAAAEVGDDVFGEDPTVNRLEAMFATRVGHDAAVFVPSGTMANLASLLAHCGRGDEVIVGDQSHTYLMEAGGAAVVGGIHPRPLPNQPNGTIDLDAIQEAIRPDNPHYPVTRLICLENTHNRCGGAVLTPEYISKVRALADGHGLFVHLDGARLYNAATALALPIADLARPVHSVSLCLSKGLAAPAGSLIAGSGAFVTTARRARKLLGGGMRQAGVLAAAGIVALETMTERLVEDHAHARALAEGLSGLPGVRLDPGTVRTNIVVFELDHPRLTPAAFAAELADRGVLILPAGGRRLRAVTHYEVSAEAVDRALAVASAVLA
jgi:threonine aldolase